MSKRKYSDVEAKDMESSVGLEQIKATQAKGKEVMKCPYLDTVNLQLIDFDSENLCSVTLSNMNVYCCLVCGKFFQGRGKSTQAFTHSVQCSHFVFMNLESARFYCLPDGYEINDSSLDLIVKCA